MEVNKSPDYPAKKGNEILPKCGIVMPISATENYTAEHWADVLLIIKDIIITSGFESNLVSDADDVGIIQKRIIQNLYNNEIIVCDVSAKNPNVMFELGIRLAFDKPTIIIKDDHTDYTFDTSIIEHISYPKDLRFNKILAFKENLKKKIIGTYDKARNDSKYSTFLKNFGEYKVAHLEEKEITSYKYIMTALEEIRNEVSQLKRQSPSKIASSSIGTLDKIRQEVRDRNIKNQMKNLMNSFMEENSLNSNDDIFSNPRLQSSLTEFIYENMRTIESITKNEVNYFVEGELLPF